MLQTKTFSLYISTTETLEIMVFQTTLKSNSTDTVKFLYSYGGKILPRHPDGKLRYIGGETRVLAVDRSISFSELIVKLGELFGSSVNLRCQLPTEDLDALVSITSDEDLINVIEEYDLASKEKSSPLKIKAFLWPKKSIKKSSPPSSVINSPKFSTLAIAAGNRCLRQNISTTTTPVGFPKPIGTKPHYHYYYHHPSPCVHPQQGSPRNHHLVHSGNYWQ